MYIFLIIVHFPELHSLNVFVLRLNREIQLIDKHQFIDYKIIINR